MNLARSLATHRRVMQAPGKHGRGLRRGVLGEFLRERRAETAVEFAMIGTVLFAFLFGIMFMGLAQFWQMVLDDSVRNAARQVELRAISSNTGFATAVCSEFGLAAPACTTNLNYDVQENPLFVAITPDTVSQLANKTGFPVAINSGHALLFQVAYKLPISLPLLPVGLMSGNGTNKLISAVAAMAQ